MLRLPTLLLLQADASGGSLFEDPRVQGGAVLVVGIVVSIVLGRLVSRWLAAGDRGSSLAGTLGILASVSSVIATLAIAAWVAGYGDRVDEAWNATILTLGEGAVVRVRDAASALMMTAAGIVFASVAGRAVGRRLHPSRLDRTAAEAVQKVVYYVLLVAVLLTALQLLHLPITSFAFLGGALALGLGIGAQSLVNNFLSGWVLLVERPIRLGDVVELNGQFGSVERIGARSTRVRRTDGVDLLVPNSHLLENVVTNWTLLDTKIRATIRVGVVYGSPTRKAAEIIRQVLDEHPSVLQEPKPDIIFEDFGDNALIFDVYLWTESRTPMVRRRVYSEIRFRIDDLFREAGIVIAFPQRDVHLFPAKPLEVRVVSSEGKRESG